MTEKAGGYYGPVFQSHRRLTQGGGLSPTIFNMVIDAVIQHWVTFVGGGGTGKVLEASIQTVATLLYTNDILVVSPDNARIQGDFNALMGLFDRVGLRKNNGKTVIMAFRPCHTPQSWSTEAYTWKVMVRVLSYRERLLQRVNCPECRVYLEAGSLAAHW